MKTLLAWVAALSWHLGLCADIPGVEFRHFLVETSPIYYLRVFRPQLAFNVGIDYAFSEKTNFTFGLKVSKGFETILREEDICFAECRGSQKPNDVLIVGLQTKWFFLSSPFKRGPILKAGVFRSFILTLYNIPQDPTIEFIYQLSLGYFDENRSQLTFECTGGFQVSSYSLAGMKRTTPDIEFSIGRAF